MFWAAHKYLSFVHTHYLVSLRISIFRDALMLQDVYVYLFLLRIKSGTKKICGSFSYS